MKPLEFKGETVLVTGGSAGIGKALARRFAAAGADLILNARDEEKLDAAAAEIGAEFGVSVQTVAADLSTEEGPQKLYDSARDMGGVFALVNNAGFGRYGSFLKVKPELYARMIRLNCEAPVMLSKFFLPDMVERGRGGILFTSSTAAFYPGPKMQVYHASKSFIQSLAEALHREMRPKGVVVTVLSPGFVNTELLAGTKSITETPMKVLIMEPDAVARAGFEAFRKGRICVVPGVQYKAMQWASQALPRNWSGFLAAKVMAPDL